MMKELLQAKVFSGFPSWSDIIYQKELIPKILRFEAKDQESVRPVYLASVISKDEKMAWQSFQDVLEHTKDAAQQGMRGFFGFDVLSVDIQSGIQNFNPADLSKLLINHARDLGPDQKALIRYGQLFALLHYRAPADWGKIEVKTHVEIFAPDVDPSGGVSEASVKAALLGKVKKTAGGLDVFFRKFLKECGQEPNAVYLVHDLSVRPLLDPVNLLQQENLSEWFEKEKNARKSAPEVYYCQSCLGEYRSQRIGA